MLDGAALSHVVFYVILGLSACTIVGGLAAMFSMGRSGYRKD